MLNQLMTILINVVGIYLILGFLFAIVFVTKGIYTIDADTKGSSFGFRMLIFPASVTFWPWLLKSWTRQK